MCGELIMVVDQKYCVRRYWCDYPRRERWVIDKVDKLSHPQRRTIRCGKEVSIELTSGYREYYEPIQYDAIVE